MSKDDSERKYEIIVKLTEKQYEGIKKLVECGLYKTEEDFIKEAIDVNLSTESRLADIDVPEETMKSIEEYLSRNPKPLYPSDVSKALGIDYAIARAAFKRLYAQGKIEPANLEP